jgi:hypothetical protein
MFCCPVVAELGDPQEVTLVSDLVLNKLRDNVLSVHINDNKSVKSQTLQFSELSAHKGYSLELLLLKEIEVFLTALNTFLFELVFKIDSPVDLRAVQHTLTGVIQDPVISIPGCVVIN